MYALCFKWDSLICLISACVDECPMFALDLQLVTAVVTCPRVLKNCFCLFTL